MLLLLGALAAGVAVRLDPRWWALLVGTVGIGAAIAVGNVILPVIIRRDFAHRLALATGGYSMALAGSAALSAGVVVPLEHAVGGGWAPAVALSGAPIVLAVALWTATTGRRPPGSGPDRAGAPAATAAPDGPPLWRSGIAWAVTCFMGLQSLGFYSTLAWAPTLLEHHGATPGEAGWLLSLSSFVSIASATLAPHLARRTPAATVLTAVALCIVAYLGLALVPEPAAPLWMTAAGIGQGAALSLALGGIVGRSSSTSGTTALSTMAQGIGYLLAALGPLLLGGLHQLSGGWRLPMLALAVLALPEAVAGLLALAAPPMLERRLAGSPGAHVERGAGAGARSGP